MILIGENAALVSNLRRRASVRRACGREILFISYIQGKKLRLFQRWQATIPTTAWAVTLGFIYSLRGHLGIYLSLLMEAIDSTKLPLSADSELMINDH